MMLALVAVPALATSVAAQCQDGTPPPCASASAARRSNPPLDDRTWIIVPFDNLASAADVDWLRNASVNLLYLDLSQWKDLRVVDDERVQDLLRESVETRDAKQVSLSAALAAARRAGAGRLVMGDVLKIGNRVRMTAKVFDVKDGARRRSTQEEALSADSIMVTFGRLARQIVGVAPSERLNAAAAGTTRLDAYQEYIAGIQALNGFELNEAKRRFERALQFDSTFALAHYKLARTIAWLPDGDPSFDATASARHAAAAQRLGTSLPARERALIAAMAASYRDDYGRACDTYQSLLRVDSLDTDALFGLGMCSYNDRGVDPVPGDSTQFRFHSSWNTALASFQRTLQLDPRNHLAFQMMLDLLLQNTREGCVRTSVPCTEQTRLAFRASLRRSADTLVTVPYRVGAALTSIQERIQVAERARTGVRRRNLEVGLTMAESWAEAAPNESQAHASLGHLRVLLGQLRLAESELAMVTLATAATPQFVLRDRVEIAIRTHRGADANRIVDSMMTSRDRNLRYFAVMLGRMLGRFKNSDSIFIAGYDQNGTAWARILVEMQHVVVGVPGPNALTAENAYLDSLAKRARSGLFVTGNLMYGLRLPRSTWPKFGFAEPDHRARLVTALTKGDTAEVRAQAMVLDSITRATARTADLDSVWAIVAADGYLTLHDSTAALRSLGFMLDSTLAHTSFVTPVPTTTAYASEMWPRAMLLRADLAAALHRTEEARLWYGRFVALWSGADAEFQPIVARARAAYKQLGGS
jgi:TolB-like protein